MLERVLIVDDDPWVRTSLRRYLQRHGFEVEEAGSCASAEMIMRAFVPRVALIDYRLPDGEAIALLRRLRHIDPSCTLLVLTGHGSIDVAVRAVKEGATEFLTKPVDMPALLRAIRIGMRSERGASVAGVVEPLFGESEPMKVLRRKITVLRDAADPVLLVGAEGTGRRTLARFLHATGARAAAPMVEVACDDEDAVRAVFGHVRDGEAARPGVLVSAAGGTVLLRDLQCSSASFRERLLLFLGDKSVSPVGSGEELSPDVRIVATADRELDGEPDRAPAARVVDAVDRDLAVHFRPGTLRLPRLKEREEDIVPLARHLVTLLGARHGRASVLLAPDAERAIAAHKWPGNVRELANVLETALILTTAQRLSAADLPIGRSAAARIAKARRLSGGDTNAAIDGASLPEALSEIERRSITRALREEGGNVVAAARRLGVPRSTLYNKLKSLGLGPDSE